jgi:hypothetical protein
MEESMIDLATLKQDHFVLWRPYVATPPPKLVIGVFHPGTPPALTDYSIYDLSAQADDLWVLPASSIGLRDGQVYHYFFEVQDSNPHQAHITRMWVTDPFAWTVDWRLLAPTPGAGYSDDQRDPAAVVKYERGHLHPCDPGGEVIDWSQDDVHLSLLPPNQHLVIYELPASWTRRGDRGGFELDVGTFRDVRALIEEGEEGANFRDVRAIRQRAHPQHCTPIGENAAVSGDCLTPSFARG